MSREEARVSRIKREANERLTTFQVKQECDAPGHECWLCRDPERWDMWFRVQLCPDTLVYTGDGGTFVFNRPGTRDRMLRWFGRSEEYLEEKLAAGVAREWSPEYAREYVLKLAQRVIDNDALLIEDESDSEIYREYEQLIYLAKLALEEPEELFYQEFVESVWDGGEHLPIRRPTARFLWCIEAVNWLKEQVVTANAT